MKFLSTGGHRSRPSCCGAVGSLHTRARPTPSSSLPPKSRLGSVRAVSERLPGGVWRGTGAQGGRRPAWGLPRLRGIWWSAEPGAGGGTGGGVLVCWVFRFCHTCGQQWKGQADPSVTLPSTPWRWHRKNTPRDFQLPPNAVQTPHENTPFSIII